MPFCPCQFSRLASPIVWLEAATQVFFSVGVGFGTLIAMSSYNPIHNNCRRDAILVSLTDSLTSVFAAVVVFSVLGFKVRLVFNDFRSVNKLRHSRHSLLPQKNIINLINQNRYCRARGQHATSSPLGEQGHCN